jgi:hypothetical protein
VRPNRPLCPKTEAKNTVRKHQHAAGLHGYCSLWAERKQVQRPSFTEHSPHFLVLFVVSLHIIRLWAGRVIAPLVALATVHAARLEAMLAASRTRSAIVAFIIVVGRVAIMVGLRWAIALLCPLLFTLLRLLLLSYQ